MSEYSDWSAAFAHWEIAKEARKIADSRPFYERRERLEFADAHRDEYLRLTGGKKESDDG